MNLIGPDGEELYIPEAWIKPAPTCHLQDEEPGALLPASMTFRPVYHQIVRMPLYDTETIAATTQTVTFFNAATTNAVIPINFNVEWEEA